ncbi:dockerin type I domain-containing protein [Pseudobacteroides cellulosolvens]|uniref:dockerin type I domain-containing protein n=1 Tax=Pseudobacteroides cellulosolvens TaxID=35825 RepID=UPI0023EA55BC|nr:dockerin type I domain-containing protein [Pseudobacteroides cellulosolvens]
MNNKVEIVGFAEDLFLEKPTVLCQNGIMTDLGTLGGKYSDATGINDKGQIVGCATTSDGNSHAFLWQNGVMNDIGNLGPDASRIKAINNNGQIVRCFRFPNEEVNHACLCDLSKILENPAPEDINGDMVVNVKDVILAATHFNTISSGNNYDIKCDLNDDGYINMIDIMMIVEKFNHTY